MSGGLRRPVGKATVPLLAVLAVVVTVAAIELYAIQKFGRRSAAPPPATPAAGIAVAAANPIGHVDAPASESIRGPAVVVSGWALAASRIRADGRTARKPGYDPFTAWRNTPLEEAAKDFLLARAHLAPGAKLWTFGAPGHADADGWTAERGTLAALPGRAVVTPDPSGVTVLVSPEELMLDRARAWRLVVLTDGAAPRALRVEGRAARDAPWVALATSAGGEARLAPGRAGAIDALRIELGFGAAGPAALVRVAILPDRNAEQR